MNKRNNLLGWLCVALVFAALLAGLLLGVPGFVTHTMDGYRDRVVTESVPPDYDWLDAQGPR